MAKTETAMSFSLRFAWWVPIYLRCLGLAARVRLFVAQDRFDLDAFLERNAQFVVKHGCKIGIL